MQVGVNSMRILNNQKTYISLVSLLCFSWHGHASNSNCSAFYSASQTKKYVSAVDKQGLRFLDKLDDPGVVAWTNAQKEKVEKIVRKNPDGTPNKMFSDVTARLAELGSTNPPLAITTAQGEIFGKAGGLVLKKFSGEEVVLAPKITLPENKGFKTVGEFKLSPDQSMVAFAYVENNKDVNHWQVVDVATGQILPHVMTVRLGDFAWSLDSKSVFYTAWPTREEIKTGKFRKTNFRWNVGSQTTEKVFTAPQPNSREIYNIEEFVDSTGTTRLLAHRVQGAADVPFGLYLGRVGTANKLRGEFQIDKYAWAPIRHPHRERLGKFVGIDGDRILFRTSEAGNKFGVSEFNVARPFGTRTLIKEDPKLTLVTAQKFGSKIVAHYLDGYTLENFVRIYDLSGNILKQVSLKDFGILAQGMISPFIGSETSPTVDFNFSTMVNPHETFRIDLAKADVLKLPSKTVDFEPKNIATKIVHIESKDGTMVPTEIYYRKDLYPDGKLPTQFVEFYYGFIGLSNFGQWNKKLQVALDAGVGVAVVHPRGGGEKGLDWQLAGKNNRMGAAEDVVAVADWLIKEHQVTEFAVGGRSFGGLLTMMLIVNFPKKFKAFIPSYGVSDVVEFSNEGTFGHAANDDWGVRRTRKGREILDTRFQKVLEDFSPLQNIEKLADVTEIGYILLNSGRNDERVDPEQTSFFAYRLQELLPHLADKILMFEHPNAGHNAPRAEGPDELTVILDKAFGIKEIAHPNKRQ